MTRVIDLSLPIRKHYRWWARVMLKEDFADGDIFRHTFVFMDGHGFTHADAPNHFIEGGADITEVPLERYCGEAVVIDLSHLGADTAVTAEELDKHGGDIREGDIVLLRTDWPRKTSWETPEFWGNGPYTDRSACEWLRDRKVKLVGYDYPPDEVNHLEVHDPLRLRRIEPSECTTHDVFLPAGIAVIEYLQNLHEIRQRRFQFFAFPLAIEGADGTPVRAVAIED